MMNKTSILMHEAGLTPKDDFNLGRIPPELVDKMRWQDGSSITISPTAPEKDEFELNVHQLFDNLFLHMI